MPALTISTDIPPPSSRSSSPTGPPMSPITPTKETPTPLPSAAAATSSTSTTTTASAAQSYPPPPASLSYTNHPSRPQTVAPPPPAPIDFDDNPDAIALKSAISILQMQSRRATDHIRTLSKAKQEALEHPEDFIADLTSRQSSKATAADKADAPQNSDSDDDDDDDETSPDGNQRAWANLPGPQNVVRCPPINWSQYAVVGDSLDRLHKEQVARPPPGAPAVYTTGVGYEFKGNAGGGIPDQYKGISAPYDPLNDKIDRAPNSSKK